MRDRLDRQLAFLIEADRLKRIDRASWITGRIRRENSAEHSWHLTLFALTLADQAPDGVRIDRVIRMLILHDLVEIDAGDAPVHGTHDFEALALAEEAAADRIFGLLPDDLAAEFRALWDEFEAAESPDAVFAKSLDRFQPPVLNLHSEGGSWPEYNVTEDQIRTRVGHKITKGAPGLWDWLSPKIAEFFGRR
ncbi:HD domain-containing protein [Nioella sp. MMSF_3534]|uniref:HD domain-containing protein n=1 Tax=Nioella sp. MMSF_3534 TaxID=3046720 RepID=UPI00273F8228|nr:HD domain-containing protein [Nioella sp. MMSF_3534]